MAKKSKARSKTRTIVRTVAAPAPVIKLSSPRAANITTRRRSRRRVGHGGGGMINEKTILGSAIGGAALGFIEKQFPSLPTLPIVGRAGAIGIAAYFWSRHGGGQIARDIAVAAGVIAGYQVGTTGKIAGDVEGDVMGVGGIAAQI